MIEFLNCFSFKLNIVPNFLKRLLLRRNFLKFLVCAADLSSLGVKTFDRAHSSQQPQRELPMILPLHKLHQAIVVQSILYKAAIASANSFISCTPRASSPATNCHSPAHFLHSEEWPVMYRKFQINSALSKSPTFSAAWWLNLFPEHFLIWFFLSAFPVPYSTALSFRLIIAVCVTV